jgi:hypothetical protein
MTAQGHHDSTLQLRKALINLQKELLGHLKEIFEKENGRSVGPGEWLQVIMVAQRYAWLRELTSLVADIDLLTELQHISPEQAGVARSEVERLFFHPESTSEFNKHYQQLMKSGAPFVMSHGHVRESTNKLPKPPKAYTAEEALEARKVWHQEHHNQSRKRRS